MNKTNYHTHTFHCGHAIGDEESMIKAAINNNIKELGFSDHIPLPHYRHHILKGIPYTLKDVKAFRVALKTLYTNGPAMRMPYRCKQIHLDNVKRLKEKYQDKINIYQGFEAEYFEDYLDYYQGLLDSGEIDYLILGNHFNKYSVHSCYYGKENITDQEIISYKDNLIKAMDTDLFSYIAHPDLFMIGKIKFDDLCKNITEEICRKALEKDIPLEINGGGIRRGLRKVDGVMGYQYPNDQFFDLVGKMGCKVVLGIDAHAPEELNDEIYELLYKFANYYHLNIIEKFEFKKGR